VDGDYILGHSPVFQSHHWLQTEWVLKEDDIQSSDTRTASTEKKVYEVQHTVHTNCTHTIHDIATKEGKSQGGRHDILSMILLISRSVLCILSPSPHRRTVTRKIGDLSEFHFHL
jgi:hypothetical protein